MVSSKLAFVLALAASVSAQTYTISDIPNCALSPALTAIGSTGCATTDLVCICKDTSFLTDLSTSIQQVCSPADYNKAVTVAQSLCLQNSVTLSVPSQAPATSAASSANSSPLSAATTGSASGSAAAPTASSGSTVAATTTSPSVVAPVSNSSTVTTSSKLPAVTANAAAVKGTWAAAGLLGVGALLAAL